MAEQANVQDGFGIDTKIVKVKDDKATAHTIMVSRFNGDSHELLRGKGYRGVYTMFTLIEPGPTMSDTDPYRMAIEASGISTDGVTARFMKAVNKQAGVFYTLKDGGVYGPDDVDELESVANA